jgi:Kef-type K+ transport system membrane component KefB
VSISARTLMEMGFLRSRVGLSLLGAAVIDDILCILAFSIFLAVTSGAGDLWGLVWLTARIALFLIIATAFGLWVLPRLVRRVSRLHISQGMLALAIITLLAYGIAAELAGNMAALIGAFLAGLMFARMPEKSLIEPGISALAYGLFVPIFFINIGLAVNLRNLQPNAIWLVLVITLAAIAGKLFGAAAGARLGGLPGSEAFQLGTGMLARGEVTLIIATMGITTGLTTGNTLSAIVVVVLLSTLVTPPLLRIVFTRFKPKDSVQTPQKESEI